jgi:hypothetical protein
LYELKAVVASEGQNAEAGRESPAAANREKAICFIGRS